MTVSRSTALGAMALLFAWSPTAHAADAFVHTASPSNTKGARTFLRHPSLDNRPGVKIFVAQVYGTYHKNPVGVQFQGGRWAIVSMNNQPLPSRSMFNVLVLDAKDPRSFVHRTNARNIRNNQTLLAHPSVVKNPRIMPLVTPRVGSAISDPLGVWWDGKDWTIYNQNQKRMQPGAQYNVLVAQVGEFSALGANGRVHRVATSGSKHSAGPHVSTLRFTNRDLLLFPTITYGQKGPYNNHTVGVWHDSKSWTVFNEDMSALPNGLLINVLAIDPAKLPRTKRASGGRGLPIPQNRPGLPGVGTGRGRGRGSKPPPPSRDFGPLTFMALAKPSMCIHRRPGVWGHGSKVEIRACNKNRTEAQSYVFDAAKSLVRSGEDRTKCMYAKGGSRPGSSIYFDTCGQKRGDTRHFIYDSRAHALRPRDNPKLCVRMANASFRRGTHLLLGNCNAIPRDASAWRCAPTAAIAANADVGRQIRNFCN